MSSSSRARLRRTAGSSLFRAPLVPIVEVERQVCRDERHVEGVDEDEPVVSGNRVEQPCTNAADVAKEDNHHERGALAVHPLRTIRPMNRERPGEAEGEEHEEFAELCRFHGGHYTTYDKDISQATAHMAGTRHIRCLIAREP